MGGKGRGGRGGRPQIRTYIHVRDLGGAGAGEVAGAAVSDRSLDNLYHKMNERSGGIARTCFDTCRDATAEKPLTRAGGMVSLTYTLSYVHTFGGWYRLYHNLLQATGAWQVPLGVPGAQGPQPGLAAGPPRPGHQSRTQLLVSVL